MLGLICVVPCRAAAQNQRDWMLGPFEKPRAGNPIITPRATSTFRSPIVNQLVRWEATATFNPAAVVRNGAVYLFYRAEDDGGEAKIGGHTSRLGLARSIDGIHFARQPEPVFYPDADAQAKNEWPGGVEDPRIIETEEGGYVMTYTQWNRSIPRLAVATSRDLVTWTKHGPAFARAADAKYLATESKSGAILGRMVGDRIVATKVNGKYWMYFSVPQIHIATSDNLIDWTPLETSDGKPRIALAPRSGYFDSWLVEPGPPALLTEHGILLMYNAGNNEQGGDPSLPARMYTAGQALFDVNDPTKLLDRIDRPFLRPTESYERTGQYPEGTTFVEGLVSFKGRWLLYYGSADSRVGVATSERIKQDSARKWVQVWSDEFDGRAGSPVDSSKWRYDIGDGCRSNNCGWGNQEKEYYSSARENIALTGTGQLRIVARLSPANLQVTHISDLECYYGACRYTSAKITTRGKMTVMPGRVEARIKLPAGQGLWPAFWMLGDGYPPKPWPACGELDIMENHGSDPTTTSSAVHGPGYSGNTPFAHSYKLRNGTSSTDFHKYAVEWDSLSARFFVDDSLHYTVTRGEVGRFGAWVFDQPFFVILNLAVGGTFDADPRSAAIFPAAMLVDYVRVYRPASAK